MPIDDIFIFWHFPIHFYTMVNGEWFSISVSPTCDCYGLCESDCFSYLFRSSFAMHTGRHFNISWWEKRPHVKAIDWNNRYGSVFFLLSAFWFRVFFFLQFKVFRLMFQWPLAVKLRSDKMFSHKFRPYVFVCILFFFFSAGRQLHFFERHLWPQKKNIVFCISLLISSYYYYYLANGLCYPAAKKPLNIYKLSKRIMYTSSTIIVDGYYVESVRKMS